MDLGDHDEGCLMEDPRERLINIFGAMEKYRNASKSSYFLKYGSSQDFTSLPNDAPSSSLARNHPPRKRGAH